MMHGTLDESAGVIDLPTRAREGTTGTVWGYGGAELNANLLVFDADEGVATHVNNAVDVLIVGVIGQGVVTVDGQEYRLAAGQALVIPKGTWRAVHSESGRFAYLTCHRHRAGLWPEGVPRPEASPRVE